MAPKQQNAKALKEAAKDPTPADNVEGFSEQHGVSMAELKEFKELFNLIDSDGSGAISKEELGNLVRILGIKVSSTELQLILNEIGSSSDDGEIEFDDFVSIMTCKISADYSQKEIKNSFKRFAKQDAGAPEGCIRIQDLLEGLRKYSDVPPDAKANLVDIINRLQVNDNYFDYASYVDMMMK
ncbi:unnamed protein product [Amoebophrya sp. A25]|nr:unnamed protein product [Amoebophrya sp. A25]|eukprot:GSA25T00017659001.1